MAAYSGLYDGVFGTPYAALADTINKGNGYDALSREFARKIYGRSVLRELLYSLVNGAVGDNATATHKRRVATQQIPNVTYGGVASIETHTSINRVTAAADVTRILAALRQETTPTYVADRSGNSGGGKLGF